MKRLLSLLFIMTLALTACDTPAAETSGTDPVSAAVSDNFDTTSAALLSAEETVPSPAETSAVSAEAEEAAPGEAGVEEEAAPGEAGVEEAAPGETGAEAEAGVEEAAPGETTPEIAEIAVTTTAATTTAATTTAATAAASGEPSVCGTYRSVDPAYPVEDAELEELRAAGEDYMLYDYIDIEQHDDGSFQAQFMLAIGSSGNDFAVFDTEALGTTNWYSFYFDGDSGMGTPYNNGSVTITPDGDSIWVTFEGGEAYEFRRTE
jgi:hypothetical protein